MSKKEYFGQQLLNLGFLPPAYVALFQSTHKQIWELYEQTGHATMATVTYRQAPYISRNSVFATYEDVAHDLTFQLFIANTPHPGGGSMVMGGAGEEEEVHILVQMLHPYLRWYDLSSHQNQKVFFEFLHDRLLHPPPPSDGGPYAPRASYSSRVALPASAAPAAPAATTIAAALMGPGSSEPKKKASASKNKAQPQHDAAPKKRATKKPSAAMAATEKQFAVGPPTEADTNFIKRNFLPLLKKHGYVLVKDPTRLNPTSWVEIQFRSERPMTTFSFCIAAPRYIRLDFGPPGMASKVLYFLDEASCVECVRQVHEGKLHFLP